MYVTEGNIFYGFWCKMFYADQRQDKASEIITLRLNLVSVLFLYL